MAQGPWGKVSQLLLSRRRRCEGCWGGSAVRAGLLPAGFAPAPGRGRELLSAWGWQGISSTAPIGGDVPRVCLLCLQPQGRAGDLCAGSSCSCGSCPGAETPG